METIKPSYRYFIYGVLALAGLAFLRVDFDLNFIENIKNLWDGKVLLPLLIMLLIAFLGFFVEGKIRLGKDILISGIIFPEKIRFDSILEIKRLSTGFRTRWLPKNSMHFIYNNKNGKKTEALIGEDLFTKEQVSQIIRAIMIVNKDIKIDSYYLNNI